MLYELRQYDIYPERWEEYLVWAETRAFPVLFNQFGMRLVGFWHNVAKEGGPAPTSNVLWLLAWESEEEMRETWAACDGSPEFKVVWDVEAHDPMTGERKYHRDIRSTLLRDLPFSPSLKTILPR